MEGNGELQAKTGFGAASFGAGGVIGEEKAEFSVRRFLANASIAGDLTESVVVAEELFLAFIRARRDAIDGVIGADGAIKFVFVMDIAEGTIFSADDSGLIIAGLAPQIPIAYALIGESGLITGGTIGIWDGNATSVGARGLAFFDSGRKRPDESAGRLRTLGFKGDGAFCRGHRVVVLEAFAVEIAFVWTGFVAVYTV